MTQGIIPLKCKTSSGRYVTAALGNVTFRNLCKAPSVGDAASPLIPVQTLLPKQLPETPTSPQPPLPVPGWCLLVTHQCQVVHDTCWVMLVASPGMTAWAAQRIGLCPSSPEPGISHVAGSPSSSCSASPLCDSHIWMCHLLPQFLPLTFSSCQVWELGVDSRSTAIKRGLTLNKWLSWQPWAHPHRLAVQSFLLFALTVPLLLFVCHT